MPKNFQIYSKYYNLLYGDKDYKAEADYVVKQIKAFAPHTKSILEFGSGTGGHGILLQKKGFDVFGLDQSEYMIAEAKKRGLPCKMANISDFKLKEKYDAVVSLFHVVSYLTENEALIATFKNANKPLNKNGIFLFDVWYSPAVYEQKAVPRIKKMQNKEISVTRVAEPKIDVNKNLVNVCYSILAKDLSSGETNELFESHPMRHFSIPEIGLLAKLTGFEVIKTEEFLTGNKPSENTWGVCFILKKI
jgi:SAM-dependent methyltransferase